jgi:hypothetical protein
MSPLKALYLAKTTTIQQGNYDSYHDISSQWAYIVLCEAEYIELRTTGKVNARWWSLQLRLRPLRQHQLLLLVEPALQP